MPASQKILVVEDEKPVSRALELKLRNAGFEVDIAGDGEEALRKTEAAKFDLILLDLILPKLDGFGFLEALRAKGNKTAVVVTSNLGQEEDKQRAEKLGVKGYFVKSNTSLTQLVEEVKKIIK